MGNVGAAWLEGLDETVARVAAEWDLQVGRVLDGGSGALVAEATLPGDIEAILKIAVPDPDLSTVEADVLRPAAGRGYARLYHDPRGTRDGARTALASRCGRSAGRRTASYPSTAPPSRKPGESIEPPGPRRRDRQAAWLEDSSRARGKPSDDRAANGPSLAHWSSRPAAAAPSTRLARSSATATRTPGTSSPQSSPAAATSSSTPKSASSSEYDLGCWLRGWRPGSGDAGDPGRLARGVAGRLAALTGTDEQAIWEWGFAERVSWACCSCSWGTRRARHPCGPNR